MPLPSASDINSGGATADYTKTLYYRYFVTPPVSPYASSYSTAPTSAVFNSVINSKYGSFRTYKFDNDTLSEPYYCPYSYNNGGVFTLKKAYENATLLKSDSISFINSIQGNTSSIKYSGTNKSFQTKDEAVENFNDLITKTDAVLVSANYFLGSNVSASKPTITPTNLTDVYIQTSTTGGGSGVKSSETTLYGKFGIFYGAKAGDIVTTSDTVGGSFVQPTTNTVIGVYVDNILLIIKYLTDIRKNPNFTSVNNESQPVHTEGDKRVDEVFDAIIDSLKQTLVALKASYKKIDPTKSSAIHANRKSIDSKMNELYQLPGTQIDSYKQYYTATMVAGAMWTVLATSLIYYVFNEL
jgi:hypothetical protein